MTTQPYKPAEGCVEEGCKEAHSSRGWCSHHYNDVTGELDGFKARAIEATILCALHEHGVRIGETNMGPRSGHTEMWPEGDFGATSIEELMNDLGLE